MTTLETSVTTLETTLTTLEPSVHNNHSPADSIAAEQLWDALFLARAGRTRHEAAELEDALFRYYLPMARALANTAVGDSIERTDAEEAAELGLAHAVLAWRHRSSGGFRRFARSTMIRQLLEQFVRRTVSRSPSVLL